MIRPRKGFVPFVVPEKFWKNNQDLTYIEAAIMYLYDVKSMNSSQIALKLDRKLSTITTQYSRIIKRRRGNLK